MIYRDCEISFKSNGPRQDVQTYIRVPKDATHTVYVGTHQYKGSGTRAAKERIDFELEEGAVYNKFFTMKLRA